MGCWLACASFDPFVYIPFFIKAYIASYILYLLHQYLNILWSIIVSQTQIRFRYLIMNMLALLSMMNLDCHTLVILNINYACSLNIWFSNYRICNLPNRSCRVDPEG